MRRRLYHVVGEKLWKFGMNEQASFGAAFGKLVKAKRRDLKITQETMAIEAFGSADRKGDVSRLENGKVANPQPFTVKRLADYLGLSSDEIEKQSDMARELQRLKAERGSLADSLSAVKELNHQQLSALAAQFEISAAEHKAEAALRALLLLKAEEYRNYRMQIAAIDERTLGLGVLKTKAEAAASDLDFEEVERILVTVHQAELDVAADTAVLRARNALMRDRANDAYQLLVSTGASYAAVAAGTAAKKYAFYARILYDYFWHYGSADFEQCFQLLSKAETLGAYADDEANSLILSETAKCYGAVGMRQGGEAGISLLRKSIEAFRKSAAVGAGADNGLSAFTNTSLCYHQMAHICAKGDREDYLNLALRDIDKGLAAFEHLADLKIVAAAHDQKGIVLGALASDMQGDKALPLLKAASETIAQAREEYVQIGYDLGAAQATHNLAICKELYGQRDTSTVGLQSLQDALALIETALQTRQKAVSRTYWARSRFQLARICISLSRHPLAADGQAYVERALHNASLARDEYTKAQNVREAKSAADLVDEITQSLGQG